MSAVDCFFAKNTACLDLADEMRTLDWHVFVEVYFEIDGSNGGICITVLPLDGVRGCRLSLGFDVHISKEKMGRFDGIPELAEYLGELLDCLEEGGWFEQLNMKRGE